MMWNNGQRKEYGKVERRRGWKVLH